MTDIQFRTWAAHIINSISGYYVLHGSYLLVAPLIKEMLR